MPKENLPVPVHKELAAYLDRPLRELPERYLMRLAYQYRTEQIFQRFDNQKDMILYFLSGRGRAPSYIRRTADIMIAFFTFAGIDTVEAPLAFWGKKDWLLRWYDSLKLGGVNDKTICGYMCATRFFFQSVKAQIVDFLDPWDTMDKKERSLYLTSRIKAKHFHDALSEKEWEDLLAYVESEWEPFKNNTNNYFLQYQKETKLTMLAWLKLAYSTAGRISELVGKKKYSFESLTWSAFTTTHDIDGKAYRALRMKRKGQYTTDQEIALSEAVEACREMLTHIYKREPEPNDILFTLFPATKNENQRVPLPGHVIARRLNELEKELKDRKLLRQEIRLHPHLTRATSLTHAGRGGASLAALQQFAGHANPATTAGYLGNMGQRASTFLKSKKEKQDGQKERTAD